MVLILKESRVCLDYLIYIFLICNHLIVDLTTTCILYKYLMILMK